MRLSREEFWVLDPTVHWNDDLPLHCLFSPTRTLFLNKRKDIGLSDEKLMDLLVSMQTQGIMAIFHQKDKPCCEEGKCCQRSYRTPGVRMLTDYTLIWQNPVMYDKTKIRDDVETIKALARNRTTRDPYPPEMLCFCMTPFGGERWEETAQVDWSKYFTYSGLWLEDADLSEDQSLACWRAAALSEQTLDAYFDWRIRWDNHPYSIELSSFKRYHTDKISPWKATYWKTFSEGYECDFTEFSSHPNLERHRDTGLTDEEEHYQIYRSESSQEHDTLFDWCNSYVRDFPFEGD